MSKIFVTASGTGVGKTFVTCALISQLRSSGRTVRALKPVATGFGWDDDESSDTELLLRAQGVDPDEAAVASISPWRFKEPLSPDMASAREQASIPFEQLVSFCRTQDDVDITLIEGIGGVMVPLDGKHTVLDWLVALRAPVLLVVGTYLGTLSHTLTAAGMLRASGVEIAGTIVNESLDQPVPAPETARTIGRFLGDAGIRVVQRLARPEDAPDLLPLLAPYMAGV